MGAYYSRLWANNNLGRVLVFKAAGN